MLRSRHWKCGSRPDHGTTKIHLRLDILLDGVGLVPVVMGLFGISEVLLNVEEKLSQREILKTKFKGLFPNLQDWKESIWRSSEAPDLVFSLVSYPVGGQ